ncbi:hypothetical protein [Rhodococcus sp. IEGM 1379]|uniref:hypothetical protein n=1 Tax=Rhodococcus sp. IEGM 1379 TaxID=3047086 RepID=UPI0024B68E2A|nr:hypothetical protein [Rhodococcus sp. IEGM 1379]MDI9918643.1 hypothetical protein [Rhodococcus sp. IEGM 1379]
MYDKQRSAKHLAWIFPGIVDSAILGSTIAIVFLSKLETSIWDKDFYIALAGSVVAISILGNAYHAFHAAAAAHTQIATGGEVGYVPLEPAIAALIAVIPPALVLAFTHGIGILIKATGIAYGDYRTQIDNHNAIPTIAAGEDATQTPGSHAPAAGFAAVMDTAQSPTNTDNAADSSTHEMQPDNRITDLDVADTDIQANTLPAIALEPDLFAELEVFIATSDLPDNVKDTARRKLADPTLTWEAIAQNSTPPVVTSTAWRRYERFDTAARAAGFDNPPLFDMRASEHSDTDQLAAAN